MTNKEFDEFMLKKIHQVKTPDYIENINVEEIIENKSNRLSGSILKISCIAASITIAITICIIGVIKLESTDNINEKTDSIAHMEDETKELYGIIETEPIEEDITSMSLKDSDAKFIIRYKDYFEFNRTSSKNALETSTDKVYNIVIAKVNDLYCTNYDMSHRWYSDVHYDNMEYVPVRTISNITVTDTIEGYLKKGDTIEEVRSNGGILEFTQYMKFWEGRSQQNVENYTFEYNALIEQGKTKVYVSEYKKDCTKLEKGKSYLMVVYKKVWGEYWLEPFNTVLREYNEEDNTVLNSDTGEYESLEEILKEVR